MSSAQFPVSPTAAAAARKRISGIIRKHLGGRGYVPAEIATIQPADVFLTRAGDQVLNRLFRFEHRGQVLALRPEFTTPALQHYIADSVVPLAPDAPLPIVRWVFEGMVYEDAGGTGQHEQYAVDAEYIGSAEPWADGEIIAVAWKATDHLLDHTSDDAIRPVVRIGHVGLVRAVLSALGFDVREQHVLLHSPTAGQSTPTAPAVVQPDHAVSDSALSEAVEHPAHTAALLRSVLASGQRQNTMGGRTADEIAERLARKQARRESSARWERGRVMLDALARPIGSDALASLLEGLENSDVADALSNLKTIIAMTEALGVPASALVIQPMLVRAWEYYTGAIFQIEHQGAVLASGGRYDELAHLLGAARNVPAVGFVLYADVFAQRAADIVPPTPVVLVPDADAPPALSLIAGWLNRIQPFIPAVAAGERPDFAFSAAVTITADGTALCGGQRYSLDAAQALTDALQDAVSPSSAESDPS